MTDLDAVREYARAALAALEASRRRIDDLNVYPVPDGDTGTNLTLTVRGVVEALEESRAAERARLAHDVSRAALMAARGNSGVILSQIVRGAAETLGASVRVGAPALAAAVRGASDAAYRAVRKPVEGTMLTLIRELAEEAERRGTRDVSARALLATLVTHGEHVVERTRDMLPVLREAGVVDAGAAGLLEVMRGIAAAVAGEPLPEPPAYEEDFRVEAVHRELSRYRYCTTFVVVGDELEADALERELERLGDSLLVVGDASALKVHLHTDDPGAALGLGTAVGVIEEVEIANMHEQTLEREARLADAVEAGSKACEAIAVVAGAGNRRLFASLGAGGLIEGGQTMNPSTEDILRAIEEADAPEAIVLPNNPNVVMSAEQAARLASRRVRVVRTESIQAGLAAMVAYDPSRSAEGNVAEMHTALETLGTGAVTVASRDAEVDGVVVRRGGYLGLVEADAVTCGTSFDDVAQTVLERLLAEPRDVVTLLVGADAPDVSGVRSFLAERYPDVALEVQDGGQPHYPLLVAAE